MQEVLFGCFHKTHLPCLRKGDEPHTHTYTHTYTHVHTHTMHGLWSLSGGESVAHGGDEKNSLDGLREAEGGVCRNSGSQGAQVLPSWSAFGESTAGSESSDRGVPQSS